MILSYKKQFPWKKPTNFKQKILTGTKIHTIREDKLRRWKPGNKIHHAHGVRTKNYDCFLENECTFIQDFSIRYLDHGLEIFIGEELFYALYGYGGYGSRNFESLARNDGFDSTSDFLRWFSSDFEGKIIHWTDFEYRP